jgi:hypothetical protein
MRTGDVVYNKVHQYLGEGRHGGLDAWHQAALDQVAALKPRFMVASHDTQRGKPASDILPCSQHGGEHSERRGIDKVAVYALLRRRGSPSGGGIQDVTGREATVPPPWWSASRRVAFSASSSAFRRLSAWMWLT